MEKSYPEVSPSAISSILYRGLQRTEDAACHRTWVACLFQLQYRVPLALVFAHAGKGPVPGRGSSSMIQSRMSESVRNIREYLETRTVSEPAENEVLLEPST
jgi:hypothetical protein